MNEHDFINWLKGYLDGVEPTDDTFKVIKGKIEEIRENATFVPCFYYPTYPYYPIYPYDPLGGTYVTTGVTHESN